MSRLDRLAPLAIGLILTALLVAGLAYLYTHLYVGVAAGLGGLR